jgi:DNA-binding NarL/FixJ family response regulator
MKIKLLLADDHPLIREGFKSLLGGNDAFEVVGEAANGLEVVSSIDKVQPDVVLMDIHMPEMNGLQVIEKLRKSHSGTRFVILSMHDEREYVMKALKAGADGYILKNVEAGELAQAIKTVHGGTKYFSAHVTNIIADSLAHPPAETPELTPREKEILGLVANGQSTKQIADKLALSIRTVESHRINMLKKVGVSNTAELIKRSIELGILE